MRTGVALLVTFLVVGMLGLGSEAAWAGGEKRPRRRIAVELQSQHIYKCTSCAEKIAGILNGIEGVTATRILKNEDAALLFFNDGELDIDEVRKLLLEKGFVTKIVWGPAAVEPDGHFEYSPVDQVPHKRLTFKQEQEMRSSVADALKSGYVPPTAETLPVPKE